MFDINSDRDINVKAIDFFSAYSGSGPVEVYVRSGSYVGFEFESSGWNLAYSQTITYYGLDQTARLDSLNNGEGIFVPQGSTVGVFMFASDMLRYQNPDALISVEEIRDNSIKVMDGTGLNYENKWAGTADNKFSPRLFRGSLV